jgi:hypothetical protein
MKKYILMTLIVIITVVGVAILIDSPTKIVEPVVIDTPTDNVTFIPVVVPSVENVTIPVAPKSKYLNKATEYYLGNWGNTPIKDRGELAR